MEKELKARPEKLIRNLAREKLEAEGWKIWTPPARSNFGLQSDIHGIWDMLAWRAHEMLFIQYTTVENLAARMQKVAHYMMDNFLTMPPGVKGEIWGLRDDGTWKVVKV